MTPTELGSGISRCVHLTYDSHPDSTEILKKTALVERSFLILCFTSGLLQVWISRYAMISDGVSYLDVGDAYFRHNWSTAINGYWSPMYSWCLGLALYVFKPSLRWEFIIVHLVNFVIYLAALLCFRFFLYSVLRAVREQAAECAEGPGSLARLGFVGTWIQCLPLGVPGIDRSRTSHTRSSWLRRLCS